MAHLNDYARRVVAGAKKWGRAVALACMFAGGMTVATTASAGRTINSLPFYENFNSNNYSDLVWITQGATHTWVSGQGFNGSGAAKFTAPMAEGYSGLGQLILGSSGLAPDQLNVRFLIYHGYLWQELGPGGKLVIMNRSGNSGRPMLIAEDWSAGGWESWAACDGTVCRYQGGDYWPNGTETFRLGASGRGRSHEWICVELEANSRTGRIKLYVDTQDGQFSGLLVDRPMDQSGTGGTWSMIDIIGGYMNRGSVRNDPENYFIIDELALNTTRIGPPANFRSNTVRPNAPTSLSVQ